MNEIIISTAVLPVVNSGDFLIASSPFLHVDRTANFNILIFVKKGTIFVTEDETDYEVNEGELLFLKSNVHHYGKYEISANTAWHYVHFFTSADADDCPIYSLSDDDKKPITISENLRYSAVLPKKLTGLSGGEIEKMIADFTAFLHSEQKLIRWKANAKLYDILTACAFYEKIEEKPISEADKIADFLAEHISEPFCAEALERKFFLSYKHMATLFKKSKGVTMQQYHNEMRMRRACRLLRSSSLSVGEIAAELGFSDMLYFSKCFHKFSGQSPTGYRENIPSMI